MYYSRCSVEKLSAVSFLTATITTTILVPCYSMCRVPPLTLNPGTNPGTGTDISHTATSYGSHGDVRMRSGAKIMALQTLPQLEKAIPGLVRAPVASICRLMAR
jgi:hypothetical protein